MIRRGPGLVRTMAATAVIAGTAQATRNAMNNHAYNKQAEQQAQIDAQNQAYANQQQLEEMKAQQEALYQQQQQQAYQQQAYQQQQYAPTPAPAAAPTNDLMAQINQLAQLHNAGILSDAEFAAAKSKVLGV